MLQVPPPKPGHSDAPVDGLVADLAAEWQVSGDALPRLSASTRRQLVAGFAASGSIRLLRRELRYAFAMLLRDVRQRHQT